MRHGTTGRRHRNNNRGHNNNGGQRRSGSGGGNNRMQVFDSNGPDVRIRGTAHQVCEKYLTLAKDAASAGDRIVAENYLQHAEHYQRIINSFEDDVRQRSEFQRPAFDQQGGSSNPGNDREDLALPSSILGASPNVNSQENTPERTGELTAV